MRRSSARANLDSGVCWSSYSSHSSAQDSFALINREQSEDALVRPFAPSRSLPAWPSAIVGVGVAGVDLHDIVDENQFECMQRVYGLVGVFGQHKRHHSQMPGMFGGVLAAVAVQKK